MVKENDFYESLGSYFIDSGENYIESQINSKLFNEIKIKITVIGINQPSRDVDVVYKIKNIEIEKGKEYKNRLAQPLQKTLDKMNSYLAFEGKNKGYKGDRNNWTVFYLLKEFITACQAGGYKYFRGQSHDWPIVPSIFRKKKDPSKEKYIYEEFENIYKNISREFPNELSYFPLSKTNLEKRTNELAILQHYGFPTTLVDITSNPFIAMMFMICFGEIKKPEFQCFRVDSDDNQNKTIISFVDKVDNNKRIKAQKGAFLNYDKLSYLSKFKKNGLDLTTGYKPIDVITFRIDFSVEESEDFIKQNDNSNDEQNKTKELSDKNKQSLLQYLPDSEGDYYNFIRKELIRKLKEYGYYMNNLFPDFDDYVKSQAKRFSMIDSSSHKVNKTWPETINKEK